MKRYQFPLVAVLRVRRLAKDHAQGAVGEALRQLTIAERAVVRAQHAYESALQPTDRQGTGAFLVDRAMLERRSAAVLVAETARVAAAAELSARRAALASASSAVAAVEELEERGLARHRREEARREGKVIDDLVTSRFQKVAQ